MNETSPNPPYFDVLFQRISEGDDEAIEAFGKHVHWGIWKSADQDPGTSADYGAAAERLAQQVCDAASIKEGQSVVDVGCGFGGTLAMLNEQFDDVSLTGINIDARQLSRAASTVTPRKSNQIRWIEADAADLPLEDSCCDRMLAVECIFHFDRAKFLVEASRVLRDGGKLAISDFVPSDQAARFLSGGNISADEAVRWSYGNVDMTCSLAGYRQLADQCGLRVECSLDITQQTLPTYEFLKRGANEWRDRKHAELFLTATNWLEKMSRKGMIQYMIICFTK